MYVFTSASVNNDSDFIYFNCLIVFFTSASVNSFLASGPTVSSSKIFGYLKSVIWTYLSKFFPQRSYRIPYNCIFLLFFQRQIFFIYNLFCILGIGYIGVGGLLACCLGTWELGFFNTWVLGGIYWPAVWVLEYLGTLIREYLGTCWPAVWVFWYFDTWLLGGHLLTWFLGTWVFDTWLLGYLGYLLTCCSGIFPSAAKCQRKASSRYREPLTIIIETK